MFRVNAIGAGAVEYLLRGSGCDHTAERVAGTAPEHEHDAPGYFASAVERGEPRGVWHGRGMAGLGLDAEAGARVEDDDVRAIFGQLRRPDSTEREPEFIGSRPRTYRDTAARLEELMAKEPDASPERLRELQTEARGSGRRPVAYYDATFSPDKTISVYYAAALAAGDFETADAIRAAHDQAVRIALDWAEGQVAWTRRGRHGIDADGQRVGEFSQATGWAVVTFAHHTNREAEPHLHTHAAILNRVATPDRHIGALDGKAFGPVKEAMGRAYERAVEQLITESTGAVFRDRADGVGREVVGVAPEMVAAASTRRSQVVERRDELIAEFRDRYGHDPDAATVKEFSQRATLETRRPKDGVAGPAAVAAWAGQRLDWCERILDDVEDAAILAAAAAAARGHGNDRGHDRMAAPMAADREMATPMATAERRREEIVAAAKAAGVADVQARYETWTIGNLVDAIDRHLGDADTLGVPASQRAAAVERLAREAVAAEAGLDVVQVTGHEPIAVPDTLRRTESGADGQPRFRPVNDQRFATGAHLASEEHVVALARDIRGPVINDPTLEQRLIYRGLSADQRAAVLGVLRSDRGAAVLIGPAGAGKSRTVGALAHEWVAATGGRVFGSATAQVATANLRGDGVTVPVNIAALLNRYAHDLEGPRLASGDLLVVDEAGMASTRDLEKLARIAAQAGARVLYAGDPDQLGAVGAGGLFAHLAETLDPAQRHDLDEVHRFNASWEAEASLRLRAGDRTVVDEYADRGRLHSGTVEEVDRAAARAYLADVVSGRSSVLVVGTNEHAEALAAHVRDELIGLGVVTGPAVGAVAVARDRPLQPISVGDCVQARLNDYTLRVDAPRDAQGRRGEARPVTNREVYQVVGVSPTGDILARDERGAIAHLPRNYLAANASLAYASTAHGVQGRTVDTAHVLLDHDASREHAYVGATRGRDENHIWCVTEREPDEHDPQRLDIHARELLAAVLERRGAARSATTTRTEADIALDGLSAVAGRFDVVEGWQARERHQAALDELLTASDLDRLTSDPGRGRLLRSLREAELSGHDSRAVLTAAAEASLAGSDSVADVLRARVRATVANRAPERDVDPTDWATRIPRGEGEVASYVRDVAEASSQRQARLGQQTADRAPQWAVDALGEVPRRHEGEGPVTEPRGRWEDRAGIAAAYREVAGIGADQRSLGAAPSRERELERALWRDAVDALGHAAIDGPRDWRGAPDAELYAARERWTREQDAAPRWVADELAERHSYARQYRDDAALERARLGQLDRDDPQAADLTSRAERSEWFAEQHQQAAADLEVEHQARRSWWESVSSQRDADAAAADELARRDLPAWRGVDDRDELATEAPEVAPEPEQVEQEEYSDVRTPDPRVEQRTRVDEAIEKTPRVERDDAREPEQQVAAEPEPDRFAALREAEEKVAAARARLERMAAEQRELEEDEFVRGRYDAAEHQQQLERDTGGPELGDDW